MVARGTEHAPDALKVSSDSRCLAFVGPTEYVVTIADARSLDEVFEQCYLCMAVLLSFFFMCLH